jgi:hypothetical protein
MATPSTQQAHQQRVDRIVAEAAERIAADSPVEEDVIVTVEEVPPNTGGTFARTTGQGSALNGMMSPVPPTQFVDTAASVVAASIAFTQRVFEAQLRFATRMANAVVPDAR